MTIPSRNVVHDIPIVPIIQYAAGHTRFRPSGSNDRWGLLTGFHTEVGRDAAFDQACFNETLPRYELRHSRPSGHEVKEHWYFGARLDLFPITTGPVAATVAASLSNGHRKATAEAGISIRWPRGEKSRLSIRGVLHQVPGFIVQLSVRSMMTDKLLQALISHVRVAEAADTLVDRSRHPDTVGLWELRMPLIVGKAEDWGGDDQTEVFPLVSGHREEVDKNYIRAIYAADQRLREQIIKAWPEVQAWAIADASAVYDEFNETGETEEA